MAVQIGQILRFDDGWIKEACQGLLEVKDEEENTLKSHGFAAQENEYPLIHFQLKTVLL